MEQITKEQINNYRIGNEILKLINKRFGTNYKGFIKIEDQIMEETVVGAGTIDNERTVSSGLATVTMSDNDIQAQYYSLISENLNGLAYVRSKSPINTAIMDVLGTFPMWLYMLEME